MYSRVHTFGKVLRLVWRGVGLHEGFPNATKAHLLLRAYSGEGIAHLLVVDFGVASKTLTNFHGAKSQAESLWATLAT